MTGIHLFLQCTDEEAFIDNISAPAPAGLPVNCLFDDYLEEIFHEETTGNVRGMIYINKNHEIWQIAAKKVLDGPVSEKLNIRPEKHPTHGGSFSGRKPRQDLPPIVGGRKKKEQPPRYRLSEGTSSSA